MNLRDPRRPAFEEWIRFPKHQSIMLLGRTVLVLGHAGITLGAAVLLSGGLSKLQRSRNQDTEDPIAERDTAHALSSSGALRLPASGLAMLSRRIDIRLLLLGSLLPDIIDKPVGQYFLADTFSNGRIFSHTLLLWLLVTMAAVWLYRARRRTAGFALSFGVGLHLILDEMWLYPKTLFWPTLGLSFDEVDLAGWLSGMWEALLSRPDVYVPELLGALILLWFAAAILTRRGVTSFVKRGRIA